MKKQITILIALLLVFTFALSACGKSKAAETEEENTINLPVVDAGGEDATEPSIETAQTEEPQAPVEEGYPFEEPAATEYDPALAYPIDPSSPTYDDEMRAYLTLLVGEKHDLQFLLDQDLTAEQWRETLLNKDHIHLMLTEGALQAIIDWLVAQ